LKEKYNLLSLKNKIVLGLCALLVAVVGVVFLNKDYLQASMIGKWEVVDSVGENLYGKITEVTISNKDISFDGEKVTSIYYGSKSKDINFSRNDKDGEIIYCFLYNSSDEDSEYYDYAIIFDKKNPENLTLVLFDDGDGDQILTLSRQ
jgi:hypothetical protein